MDKESYTVRINGDGTVGVFEGDEEVWFCRKEDVGGVLRCQEWLCDDDCEKLPSEAVALLWHWLAQTAQQNANLIPRRP